MEQNNNKKKISSIVSWSITSLLVIMIGIVIMAAGLRKAEKPSLRKKRVANVEVATIKTEEYRESLTLPALIEADRVAAIKSEYPGTLEIWLVREGESVQEGQLVAELNIDMLMANIEELKASMTSASKNYNLARIAIESAELELENSRKKAKIQELALKSAESDQELVITEVERIRKLVKKNIMDRSQLDTARNNLKQAELAVERAEEGFRSAKLDVRTSELQIKQAKTSQEVAHARLMELDAAIANTLVRINKSHLTAPISGRLESHLIEPGEVATAGEPIAHIYDLSYLRATVNVPDRFVAFIDPRNPAAKSYIMKNRPGSEQEVHAKLIIPGLPDLTNAKGDGMEFDAEIAHIAQSSDPESNTFKVELRFTNPGNALRHGVIARGKIEYLKYPQAIMIPAKSIQVTDVGPRVMVVEEAGGSRFARVRDIEPLSIHESKILIGKGLSEGDKLVVSGWKGLVGGEEVNVLVEDGRFLPAGSESERKGKEG